MKKVELPFNPVTMSACNLIDAANVIRHLMEECKRYENDPKEFMNRFKQFTAAYEIV